MDALINGRFLQVFHNPFGENKSKDTSQFLFKFITQALNKNPRAKHQRVQSTPYQKQSSITQECVNCTRNNFQKRNNFQNDSRNTVPTTLNHHKNNINPSSAILSESSADLEIMLQLNSTVPHQLSSALSTSCSSTDYSWAKVTRTEEIQLRNKAWYQPGLSR